MDQERVTSVRVPERYQPARSREHWRSELATGKERRIPAGIYHRHPKDGGYQGKRWPGRRDAAGVPWQEQCSIVSARIGSLAEIPLRISGRLG